MNQQPKYRIYATLLDAFGAYLNSDVIWDKYWGWSENPPHTPAVSYTHLTLPTNNSFKN